MPGIDFRAVRARVPMSRVLELLGFQPLLRRSSLLRGPCPVHRSRSPRSLNFSVELAKNCYQCFSCGSAGNQLDLWAAVHHLSHYEAAKDLCRHAGVEIPWLHRW